MMKSNLYFWEQRSYRENKKFCVMKYSMHILEDLGVVS